MDATTRERAPRGLARGTQRRGPGQARLPQAPAARARSSTRWVAIGGHGDTRCGSCPRRSASALRCGVAYAGQSSRDFAKLATLGTEGRSTATTILSLAAVRGCAASRRRPARGAGSQAPVLHRQPAGRVAPSRPLQRLRPGRPAARRAPPRRRRRRRRRPRPTSASRRGVQDAATCPSATSRPIQICATPRAPRPSGACATCSAIGSTATCGAAGGSPRRTSSSAVCSRSTTTSLDEICARRGAVGRRPRRTRGRVASEACRGRPGAARLLAPRARDQGRLPRRGRSRSSFSSARASACTVRGRSTTTRSSSTPA